MPLENLQTEDTFLNYEKSQVKIDFLSSLFSIVLLFTTNDFLFLNNQNGRGNKKGMKAEKILRNKRFTFYYLSRTDCKRPHRNYSLSLMKRRSSMELCRMTLFKSFQVCLLWVKILKAKTVIIKNIEKVCGILEHAAS